MPVRPYTIDQMLVELETTVARRGSFDCPMIDEIKAMRDAGATYEQVEKWILCDRPPHEVVAFMIGTARYNVGAARVDIQTRCAAALTMHDWAVLRPSLERAIHERLEDICPEALRVLIGFFVLNHPDPRAFFIRFVDRMPASILAEFDGDGLLAPAED